MIFKGRKVLDGTLAAIQDQYGNDTLRLRAEGGMSRLNGLAGVEKAIDFGRLQELRMRPGSDPQQVLAEIMSRTPVYSFEVAKPTLYDIFLRIAGEEARNRDDA